MSNKKQGVGVMWRGNNGGEREMWRGYADNYGAKPTVWLRLTLDCNLHSPRDLSSLAVFFFTHSHAHSLTLGWLKACHYVLAKQRAGFIALMCMCLGPGHVEKVVWVKEIGERCLKPLTHSLLTHACVYTRLQIFSTSASHSPKFRSSSLSLSFSSGTSVSHGLPPPPDWLEGLAAGARWLADPLILLFLWGLCSIDWARSQTPASVK